MTLTNTCIFEKLTNSNARIFLETRGSIFTKDRGDYQSLSPEQKHIFTSNLKYQVLLDSVQGRGIGMAFQPYCSLPELEGAMEVWEFMEMIHSDHTHTSLKMCIQMLQRYLIPF